MSRTRLIRPAFFKHAELFDAEQATGLPLRLAFAGLWTVCDKEGRFPWKPRDIKADVMPHDVLDFAAVLDALWQRGFVQRYRVDGKEFGCIPSWSKHQHPHKTERPSTLPSPLDNGAVTVISPCNAVAVTDTGTNYSADAAKNAAPPAQGEPEGPRGRDDDRAQLWTLIRTHLYVPDGKPPAGYDESRDGSILTLMLKHHPVSAIAVAIEGIALVRDAPGRYTDPVDWLHEGDKVTLRALWNTRSGATQMFEIASRAFWKRENARPPKEKSAPESTGGILHRLGRVAS